MLGLIKESDFSSVKKIYLDVGTRESDNEKTRKAYLQANEEAVDVVKEIGDENNIRFKRIMDSHYNEKSCKNCFH